VKIWQTSEEGPCLPYDKLLAFLRTQPKIKPATVEGLCGISEIKVAPILAWIGCAENVWVDVKTGTLYFSSGKCCTSSQRKIVSQL